MKHPILVTALILLCSSAAFGQRESDANTIERVLPTFTKLLGSEQNARSHIADLQRYQVKSPFRMQTILFVSQRLLVLGVKTNEILATLPPCGDAAIALNQADSEFADIALTIGELLTKSETYASLKYLEQKGLPVFDMLGEVSKKAPSQIEELSLHESLTPKTAGVYLLRKFTERYGGLAEKAAEKKRKNGEK
jgi:hypothetical protein